jgi:hypothetical protein
MLAHEIYMYLTLGMDRTKILPSHYPSLKRSEREQRTRAICDMGEIRQVSNTNDSEHAANDQNETDDMIIMRSTHVESAQSDK